MDTPSTDKLLGVKPEPRKGYSANGKKIGRPSKKELTAKKVGNRGKPGRPPGDKAIMDQYKARMLSRPDSEEVINAIYQAALDNEHKNQAAAWKIITDRMLPVRMFEEGVKGGGRPTVNISISSVSGNIELEQSGEDEEGNVIEGEYE